MDETAGPPPRRRETGRRDYIVMMTGRHAGATYLAESSMIVGRHAECDIVLHDSSASRRHVSIQKIDAGLVLQDLDSSNGTYLNGTRVSSADLSNGDRIQIGSTVLKVFSEDELEARLRNSQKMESLGRLASGAAHDFNNILSVVTASASLIKELSVSSETRALANSILDASENAAKITRQMLSIARRTDFKRQAFDLRQLVTGLETAFHQRTRGRIELSIDLQPNLWVLADYGQLEHVALNLFGNAVDSIDKGGGGVQVRAESVKLGAEQAAELDLQPGVHVHLTVTDTGSGMDDLTLRRAVEPYFTTKAESFGAGLGLPVTQGIVEGHDGAFVLRSRPGEGTVAEVWLPQVEPSGAHPEPSPAGSETTGRAKRERLALIVDENLQVRRAVSEMLGFLGYRSICASRQDEADAHASEHDFDLAVVDVQGRNGGEFAAAREMRRRNPSLKIVTCSTCYDGAIPDDFKGSFLRKPFELSALSTMVGRFD